MLIHAGRQADTQRCRFMVVLSSPKETRRLCCLIAQLREIGFKQNLWRRKTRAKDLADGEIRIQLAQIV